MFNEILGRRSGAKSPDPSALIIEKDKALRKAVADLYSVLSSSNQADLSVNLLAEHVSIMVDMINEFKAKGRS